jgi:hypothetical protein
VKAAINGCYIADALRTYSVIILLLEITFVCTVGVNEDPEHAQSYDQVFKKSFPLIYGHLTYIGFRMHEDPGHVHDPKE